MDKATVFGTVDGSSILSEGTFMQSHHPSIQFFLGEYHVLDNFSANQITWRDALYPTAEHAYQAAKFFETAPHIAELIRTATAPSTAKAIAQEHRALCDPAWTEKKQVVMEDILRTKLAQHPALQTLLLQSDRQELVEANPLDEFWGAGANNTGQNILGRIWMKLREELQNTQ
jgi:ribA/ribD-fused uncharacterized protein